LVAADWVTVFSAEWRKRLKLKDVPWIANHQVGEDVIFPAAGYLAMAIEAVTQTAELRSIAPKGYTVQRLFIKAPMIIPPEGEVETLFNLRILSDPSSPEDLKWFDFSVSSVTADDKWSEHAVGKIALEASNEANLSNTLQSKGLHGAENRESSDCRWCAALADIGLHYGPSFRPVKGYL
jgi:acyl transferase domain-containing protein